jgi:hypothetical protein
MVEKEEEVLLISNIQHSLHDEQENSAIYLEKGDLFALVTPHQDREEEWANVFKKKIEKYPNRQ